MFIVSVVTYNVLRPPQTLLGIYERYQGYYRPSSQQLYHQTLALWPDAATQYHMTSTDWWNMCHIKRFSCSLYGIKCS